MKHENEPGESKSSQYVPLTATPFQSTSEVCTINKQPKIKKILIVISVFVALFFAFKIAFAIYAQVRINSDYAAIENAIRDFSSSMSAMEYDKALSNWIPYDPKTKYVASEFSQGYSTGRRAQGILQRIIFDDLAVNIMPFLDDFTEFDSTVNFSKEDITLDRNIAFVNAHVKMSTNMASLHMFSSFYPQETTVIIDQMCTFKLKKTGGKWYISSME